MRRRSKGIWRILRRTISRSALLAVLLLSWTAISAGQQPVVTVVETVWTKGIDNNKNPVNKYEDLVEGARRLYLWTRVRGGEKALQYLKARNKLPIFHQWYVYLGADPQFEGTLHPTDAIKLTVGNQEAFQKLSWELQEKGYFEWRTWSAKARIRPGWWKVRVVYADGEPVLCSDEPCEYVIEIE